MGGHIVIDNLRWSETGSTALAVSARSWSWAYDIVIKNLLHFFIYYKIEDAPP